MTDTITTAGEAIRLARTADDAHEAASAARWLKAAGLTHTARLAGASVAGIAKAAGDNLRDAQIMELAGLAMAKGYTPTSLCADWDTLPKEWASVLAACRLAMRSVDQGGCGAKAAKAAIDSAGTPATAAESLAKACGKAKAEKAKADADAKRAKREAELGQTGLLLADVQRIAKAAGGLKGRTGWTPEALRLAREAVATLADAIAQGAAAVGE